MMVIENWKQSWKLFSVQALAVAGTIPVIWSQLPDDVKAMIPASWMGAITAVVAVCGIVGRLVKQPAASDPK
ncbi:MULTISPECIES: hypothetical protein [Enterobacteriaceae]|jgi:hypothetical protein|uniref:DUF7940 domain-containing protein n=2 Tax=Enterobacterales TaxID=91347 RepID=UPI0009A78CFA|nr:hypothetical protein [Phytobacter diazotrophicus]MBY6255731.1 hypothetical protein [Phytobacter diazotrophicus]PTA88726.1 hypothetical protein C9415_24805 [Kluyvera sp. Nf5]SLJ96055.1 hypothetical protein SAMN03159434_102488 [Enterobacter sp. NFR05]